MEAVSSAAPVTGFMPLNVRNSLALTNWEALQACPVPCLVSQDGVSMSAAALELAVNLKPSLLSLSTIKGPTVPGKLERLMMTSPRLLLH